MGITECDSPHPQHYRDHSHETSDRLPGECAAFEREMASIAGLYGGFGTNQEDGSGGRNLFSRFKKDIIKEQAEERRKQAEKDE